MFDNVLLDRCVLSICLAGRRSIFRSLSPRGKQRENLRRTKRARSSLLSSLLPFILLSAHLPNCGAANFDRWRGISSIGDNSRHRGVITTDELGGSRPLSSAVRIRASEKVENARISRCPHSRFFLFVPRSSLIFDTSGHRFSFFHRPLRNLFTYRTIVGESSFHAN